MMKHRVKTLIANILLFLYLVACSQSQYTVHNHSTIDYTKPYKYEFHFTGNSETKPLFPVKDDNVLMIKGWISNEEILYVSNINGHNQVIIYNLFSGKKEILF